MLFEVLYSSLGGLYLYTGVHHINKDVKAALKCLPLLVLIVWFIYQWKYPGEGSWKCVEVDYEKSDDATFTLFVLGLVCSVIGDFFLVGHFKISFPLGVIAFAIAQILYSIIFTSFFFNDASLGSLSLSALLVGLIDLFVTFIVYSKLKRLLGRIKEHQKLVVFVILLYFGLISLMLWSSLSLFVLFYDFPSLLGLLGGSLFYISDACIALSAIYELVIFRRRILVMLTYYASQFFVATCVLSLCMRKK